MHDHSVYRNTHQLADVVSDTINSWCDGFLLLAVMLLGAFKRVA